MGFDLPFLSALKSAPVILFVGEAAPAICIQIMPEESVNDNMFLDYATAVPDTYDQ